MGSRANVLSGAAFRVGAAPVTSASVAAKAAMSPWLRQALSWMGLEEPERLADKFSAAELARIGDLDRVPHDANRHDEGHER